MTMSDLPFANSRPGDARLVHRYAELGDVRLHYVEAGTGPLVILLHGFPEFWYSWRHQITALATAGYHAVAPDMRGYNLSDKPSAVHDYRIDLLARDVARLIRACGAERATVVGHNWGAGVAWQFAMSYPTMLDRLVIMNVPHPIQFLRGMRTWRQLRKSWYIFFFQIPRLPEAILSAGDFSMVRRIFRSDPARTDAFTEEDIDWYIGALRVPGALTGAINYYRALFRRNPVKTRGSLKRIDAPVLVIWGERDRFLGPELAVPDRKWVPDQRVERLPGASHWVQVDQPEAVNRLLLAFLQESRRQAG
jgi:pimeloyl-ACP methyl ester carboxylesterase